MSSAHEVKKAKHDFETFINQLSAFSAEHTAFGDADSPDEPFVEVARNEALNAFLAKHPQYNEFKAQLSEVHADQNTFYFAQERWQNISTDISE